MNQEENSLNKCSAFLVLINTLVLSHLILGNILSVLGINHLKFSVYFFSSTNLQLSQ